MRKLIIITSAVMPAIAVLCTALYLRGGQDVFLTLAITFATISYHFIMRLIVGGIVNSTMHNRADLSRPWFRQRDWERKLYRLLKEALQAAPCEEVEGQSAGVSAGFLRPEQAHS